MLAAKWQAEIMTLIFMKFMRDTHLNSTTCRCLCVCSICARRLSAGYQVGKASCVFFSFSFLILIREKFFLCVPVFRKHTTNKVSGKLVVTWAQQNGIIYLGASLPGIIINAGGRKTFALSAHNFVRTPLLLLPLYTPLNEIKIS